MDRGKSIRHDLRTPLNHIIGYSEMLIEEMDVERDTRVTDLLQVLRDGGRRLLETVNRPVEVRPEQSADALFPDWRERLALVEDRLAQLQAALAGGGERWLADVGKIAKATAHLRELLEQLGSERVAASVSEPMAADSSSPTTAGVGMVDGHLLIVDDNAANLEIMQRRLLREGYRVSVATGGAEALGLIETTSFDVIMLDLLMPGMNGLEVLHRIRRTRSSHELPVIVVTARYGSATIVEALAAGANDYITKPVDFPVALARIGTQLYLRRVTRELAEANEQLRRFSYIDGLTGIANRRQFDEYLARAWQLAQRHSSRLSLVMLDVDHFKLYNDNYGHEAGDQVLIQVAGGLKSALYRQGDMVARYGGEEFVAVLPDTAVSDALAIAERLRCAISELAIPHEHHLSARHVTVSLGVADWQPTPACTPERLVVQADKALYQAKRRGRNRVEG